MTRAASELRIVLGQLVRRLRAQNTLPISQGTVLARLEQDGAQTTSTLAAVERMRPQSMAQTVRELETAGLVTRHPDPGDRRRVLVEAHREAWDHPRHLGQRVVLAVGDEIRTCGGRARVVRPAAPEHGDVVAVAAWDVVEADVVDLPAHPGVVEESRMIGHVVESKMPQPTARWS